MNACLVVDAGVRRPTIAYVHLHPEPRVADEVALDDGWQSPDIHQLHAPGVELIVHRFRHAPGTTEAERQPDLAAVAAAGALEPRDTAARLAAWQAARAHWPHRHHLMVFDDAWFATLPAAAASYALPAELTAAHGLRRRGRHGPLHRLAAGPTGRVVSVYLGPESSAAAVADGQPVEITAGATGLEGIPGGETAGDLDPAAVLYLVEQLGLSVDQAERALGEEGGLAGVSGGHATIAALRAADDEDALLALRFLAHRVKRAIGALSAVMGGLDALVFSTADGFDDAPWRAELTAGLAYLGVGSRVPVRATALTPILAAAVAAQESA